MTKTNNNNSKPLNLVSELIGKCLCEPFAGLDTRGMGPNSQFVILHGIKFIGLGALADELTPRERVYDTLEQLTTRTQRLVSIGYLIDETVVNDKMGDNEPPVVTRKGTQTIPLDIWNEHYPTDNAMSREVKNIVTLLMNKDYEKLADILERNLERLKNRMDVGHNEFLAGITAHNLAVVRLITGRDNEAISMFEEAVILKEAAFGGTHSELGLTWDELGVQYFAKGRFEDALATFRKAHTCRLASSKSQQGVDVVMNNMACCNFQMRNHRTALLQLQEAREIQQQAIGSAAQADLDLLHIAVVLGNCGYLQLCLKEYEVARSLFEEALLIQQSVLDDSHRAVRDTLNNIEFTNAFHS